MHELNLVDVQKRYKEKDAVIGFTFTFTNGLLQPMEQPQGK